MSRDGPTLRETVVHGTKFSGILPCVKLHRKDDFPAYAQALCDSKGWSAASEVRVTLAGIISSNHPFLGMHVSCYFAVTPKISTAAESSSRIHSMSFTGYHSLSLLQVVRNILA
jgi:hypothetical protein